MATMQFSMHGMMAEARLARKSGDRALHRQWKQKGNDSCRSASMKSSGKQISPNRTPSNGS